MPASNNTIQPLADFLRTNKTFLLVPHERADGDALGSMLALARGLELQGKKAIPLLLSDVSERYRFLFGETFPSILGGNLAVKDIPDSDAVILIDTGVRQQVQPILPLLDRRTNKLIVIDHHASCDLSPDFAFIDEASPATGLLVGKLLGELGWLNDSQMAEYLLVAIASDTGWFSYGNTTADCFWWAGRLAELGADSPAIYQKLFLSDSPQRFRLLARALSGAELRVDNRLVVMTLRQEDFEMCGANQGHTENLIDQACRLKSMLAAILFVEQAGGIIRMSLRSRDPFDVDLFARQFGGGGHRQAAGMRIEGSMDEVKTKVLAVLEEDLKK
ncbi:MAG: bifunctional oligoribonuclease/PAP phosphatase NrnA [Phycisphaerae bacterium]